jgi:hypothetical protein
MRRRIRPITAMCLISSITQTAVARQPQEVASATSDDTEWVTTTLHALPGPNVSVADIHRDLIVVGQRTFPFVNSLVVFVNEWVTTGGCLLRHSILHFSNSVKRVRVLAASRPSCVSTTRLLPSDGKVEGDRSANESNRQGYQPAEENASSQTKIGRQLI